MESKKHEALQLAEELLGDIELKRLDPTDIFRKASRLARLTDDAEATLWLYYEVAGFPEGANGLDQFAWKAATRSNRVYLKDGKEYARTSGIGQIQAGIDSANIQLSTSSQDNIYQRTSLSNQIVANRGVLDRVVGSVHMYVMGKYQELRFGAAVETAFENIRTRVDSKISQLVPQALPILTTALENASGDNEIQWSNAAKACRDLIKSTADALRPPGKPKNGRKMSDADYVNRLVDWIELHLKSSTLKDTIVSDLNDLGKRLDALHIGGHKGAHTTNKISKEQASRYVVGTYMLLGDILALQEHSVTQSQEPLLIDEATADSAEPSKDSALKDQSSIKK